MTNVLTLKYGEEIDHCTQCTQEYFLAESNAQEKERFCSKDCEDVWHTIWDGYE